MFTNIIYAVFALIALLAIAYFWFGSERSGEAMFCLIAVANFAYFVRDQARKDARVF